MGCKLFSVHPRGENFIKMLGGDNKHNNSQEQILKGTPIIQAKRKEEYRGKRKS